MMQLMLQRGKADVLPHVSPVCVCVYVCVLARPVRFPPPQHQQRVSGPALEGPFPPLDSAGPDLVRQVLIQVM